MRKGIYLLIPLFIMISLGFIYLHPRTDPHNQIHAQTAATANDIIDQIIQPPAAAAATDVANEITDLVTGYVNDTNDYNGLAIQANHVFNVLLYFRARNTSVLAPLIPLLPGTISDTTTLKGKLAARLKKEVTNYLLQQGLWDFEHIYDQNTTGATSWFTPIPNTYTGWYHRYNSGPFWEKFYAIWAYANYTGDWTTVQNGLSFIKARYNEGDQTRANQEYFYGPNVYRDDPVHLVLGLIGFTRILDHFNDTLESTVRAKAVTALGYLNDNAFTGTPVSAGTIHYGWDRIVKSIQYEYQPCQEVSPEIGRWYQTTQAASINTQINQALTSTPLKDRYHANMFNIYNRKWPDYDESVWGLPDISYELFNCRAWVSPISYTQLKSEKPWPVTIGRIPKYRDMLYLESLYNLLIKANSTPTWQVAEPN